MGNFLRRILGLSRRRAAPMDGMPRGRWDPLAAMRAEMNQAVAASNAAELARTGADAPDVPRVGLPRKDGR
jgi:hypothetical protein